MLIRGCVPFIVILILIAAPEYSGGQSPENPGRAFRELTRFDAADAHQGVAVDSRYFYTISTRAIGKYDKATGAQIERWEGMASGPIIHLDSGVIVNDTLVCAHSNYPGIPMTSSVEMWDAETLEHIGTHSFGIHRGSCTWIDRHDGYWWAVFANYNRVFGRSREAYGNSYWTSLVKFDDHWQWLESWVFPDSVIGRALPMSISGGSWGPDNVLYCTGHDREEVYVLALPEAGSVLTLLDIVSIPTAGQGIAWDRSNPGMLYGIDRSRKQVVRIQLTRETR